MRGVIKELAFKDNAMFDGNGYIKNLEYYIEEMPEDEEGIDGEMTGFIDCSFMNKLHKNLRGVFSGEDVVLGFPCSNYSDMFISVDVSNGAIDLRGDFDGPINNIIPKIKTNIFNMSDDKDYYLYIDDFFGGLWDQRCSAELYIDLIVKELE